MLPVPVQGGWPGWLSRSARRGRTPGSRAVPQARSSPQAAPRGSTRPPPAKPGPHAPSPARQSPAPALPYLSTPEPGRAEPVRGQDEPSREEPSRAKARGAGPSRAGRSVNDLKEFLLHRRLGCAVAVGRAAVPVLALARPAARLGSAALPRDILAPTRLGQPLLDSASALGQPDGRPALPRPIPIYAAFSCLIELEVLPASLSRNPRVGVGPGGPAAMRNSCGQRWPGRSWWVTRCPTVRGPLVLQGDSAPRWADSSAVPSKHQREAQRALLGL